ncbi:PepSY domain-containing protein [Amycolatopsis sp. NPDC003865]
MTGSQSSLRRTGLAAGAKLGALGTQFHTGTLFGLANQIVLALVAVATLVLHALGYRMWWIHNPYRGRWASLPRPAWRRLAAGPLIVALLGIAVLAWVLPMAGASLMVFLAIRLDVLFLARPRFREVRLSKYLRLRVDFDRFWDGGGGLAGLRVCLRRSLE